MSAVEIATGPGSVPAPTRRSRVGAGLQALVLFAPVVWIGVLAWTHRWMTEDGFIYLRIVRQIAEGNGPVFNDGERVEAYTGVLWVALLSIADLLTPVRLEWLSILLGLVGTAAAVALAIVGARRLWGHTGGTLLVPFGAVVFVALYPVWGYATSGLETGLVFTWLGACLWILGGWARGAERRVGVAPMVVLGLGWLLRPEMVLFSAAFVLVVLGAQWSDDAWRDRFRLLGAALALPLVYQVFRMGYFGSVVANTAIAKEGTGGNVERGLAYFSDFAGPYWLWVPLVGLVAGGYVPLVVRTVRRREWRQGVVAATFVACAALNATYVVYVGGDYHHGRMFLPALFAICAPVAAVPATRRHLAGVVVVAWAVTAAISLRPDQLDGDDWLAGGFLAPREFGSVTTDQYGWGASGPRLAWYVGPAYYYEAGINHYVAADTAIRDDVDLPLGAFWGIGISAYSLGPDFDVIDQLGLADSFTAHLEGAPSLHPLLPRFPGHEKPIPGPWLAARVTPPGTSPDPAHFPPFGNPLLRPTTGAAFQEQVAWARAALRCDEIDALLDSSRAPLTVGRFASNVGRSVDNTLLRIPADPETAYRKFCGTDRPPEVVALRTQPSSR